MDVKPILRMGNPLLRQIAASVEYADIEEIRTLVTEMIASMNQAGGVGLAAPQIGELSRVIIFSVPADRMQREDESADMSGIPQTVLINPEITPLSDEMALGWEGCLSVPDLRGLVPRYTHIRYCGLDMNGTRLEREAKGFHARVVQHEVDHLDGILYPERMTDMRNLVYCSEQKAFMAALNDVDG